MATLLSTERDPRSRLTWVRVAGVIGALFGLMTIREGGAVLFVDGPARVAAGDYVPFVLWFNFLAGFAYVIAGVGLLFVRPWAAGVALVIVAATLGVFAIFGAHVFSGGAFEMRTVVAMTLRSVVWCSIAVLSCRSLLSPTAGIR